jgi:hypothetical protein
LIFGKRVFASLESGKTRGRNVRGYREDFERKTRAEATNAPLGDGRELPRMLSHALKSIVGPPEANLKVSICRTE